MEPTEREKPGTAERPRPTASAGPARVTVPAPANQNRAPLARRLARIAALVICAAIAVWLLRSVF